MNILYIWDADYPWDVRVEKICRSLISAGHEVHIASRNLKRKPTYDKDQGLHIHRMSTWKNDKLNYGFSFPAFFSPFWKQLIDSIIIRHAVDLIIVRDLPMAPAAIMAGKRHDIPVVFDMAEDYVAMVLDIWRARKYQGLNLIVRNPYLAKLVEKYSFKNADYIFVVVEEAKGIVAKGGGDIQHTSIVGNTPSLDIFHDYDEVETPDMLNIIKKHFSVIYTGGIGMGRGIQTVIDAIPHLIDTIPDFLFVIVGAGYYVEKLKEKVDDLGVQKHVMWIGWVEHDIMYNYIKESKVGLIPHFVSDHVNTTIPNKIFDYMGFGLPIVATDAVPLKRIIEEEKCGVCFKSGDAKDLVKAILYLYQSGDGLGNNGSNAVKNKYNWKKDETRLLETVNKLTA